MIKSKEHYLQLTKATLIKFGADINAKVSNVEVTRESVRTITTFESQQPIKVKFHQPLELACSFCRRDVWVFVLFKNEGAELRLQSYFYANEGLDVYKVVSYNKNYEAKLSELTAILSQVIELLRACKTYSFKPGL